VKFFSLMVLLSFVLLACGTKGPPSLEKLTEPPAPQDLRAVQRADTVLLTWNYGKTRVKEFIVEEKVDGGEWEKISTQTDRKYSSFVVYDVTYTFRVRARSVYGVLGPGAEITIPVIEPPAPPEDLSVNIGPESLTLSWDYPQGFTFNVYKTNAEIEQLTMEPIKGMRLDLPPEPDKEVTYEVRALKGGPFMYEGEGARITVSPKDFVPVKAATPEAVLTETGVRLFWKPNPEAWVGAYVIYRESGGEYKKIAESAIPSYFDPDLTATAYRVSAKGPVSEGPLSEPAVIKSEVSQ
jgi:predicted small lipoprotein YifL